MEKKYIYILKYIWLLHVYVRKTHLKSLTLIIIILMINSLYNERTVFEYEC